ncbi:MAG: ABC-type Fe3+ transport system, permease component [Planctomycetota bacterium]|nr:ABC-type Fe3+ transport system, permease component [Planctomycetota bacterium]
MIGPSRFWQILLILAIFAVLGWPALSTAWQAAIDVRADFVRPASPAEEAERDTPSGRYLGARPLSLAWNTIKFVGLTLLIAMTPGVALAWLLFRTDLFGRRLLLAILGLALFVPMPLHALAWIGSFGNAGRSQALGWGPVIAGLPGAAFVHAMAALPWVVFIAGVGLRTVEPELEESARMDLSAWQVAVRITLRRSLGAIVGAALAVTVLTAGDMTVTDLLSVRTYAEEAYIQAQLTNGQGAAAAIAAGPMLVVLGGLILWAARTLVRADPARLPSAHRHARTWSLGRWRIPLGVIVLLTVGNLFAMPVYGLIWRSGRVGSAIGSGLGPRWSLPGFIGSLRQAWPDLIAPRERGPWYATLETRPLLATLFWSSLAASLVVSLAWPLAWLCRERGPWRLVASLSAALALATPGPIVGEALKRAYLKIPIIYDTPALLVIAYVARTLPYALLVLWPAVRAIPREHLDAAMLDGLNAWGRFRKVGLPLTLGAIAAAWGVAFVLAIGELPASYFAANPGREPVAFEVWRLLHNGVESHLASVGLLLLAGVGFAGAMAMVAVSRVYRVRD